MDSGRNREHRRLPQMISQGRRKRRPQLQKGRHVHCGWSLSREPAQRFLGFFDIIEA